MARFSSATFGACCFVGLVCGVLGPLRAKSPLAKPPLPKATGRVLNVRTVPELYRAAELAPSNATILLAPGTYNLTRPVHFHKKTTNLTIRGATGRYSDVVLRGKGMGNEAVYHGILVEEATDLLIADMTIGWVGFHPIQIKASCRNPRVYGCRMVNAGEQFVKVDSNGKGSGVVGGKVEYCIMEYTDYGPADGYTNGVDVHSGSDWEIRHNLFRNIRTPKGSRYKYAPAVLMWNGSKRTVCEGNTFINCDRGIAFGLALKAKYVDEPDHEGGLIRNNLILVQPGQVTHPDAGIYVASPNTKVFHNTVLINRSYVNAIEVRFPTTVNVHVRANLTDRKITARAQAQFLNENNQEIAPLGNVTARLSGIRQALQDLDLRNVDRHQDAAVDFNGRDRGETTTVGADEPQ